MTRQLMESRIVTAHMWHDETTINCSARAEVEISCIDTEERYGYEVNITAYQSDEAGRQLADAEADRHVEFVDGDDWDRASAVADSHCREMLGELLS